ncbi:hypothetical protein M0R45_026221 [Rubus argutus]|uniref:Uncharacterized protein n=1 Tax=Rubus argutus TaxID=59490 RepID=A0AAW1WZG4_RUBAR
MKKLPSRCRRSLLCRRIQTQKARAFMNKLDAASLPKSSPSLPSIQTASIPLGVKTRSRREYSSRVTQYFKQPPRHLISCRNRLCRRRLHSAQAATPQSLPPPTCPRAHLHSTRRRRRYSLTAT